MYQAPKNLKEKVLKIYKICGIVVGVWFCAWGSNFDPSLCKLICKEDDIISYHINLWYQLIAIYENRLM